MDLMLTFPDAKTVFLYRAQARRIEFRRIRKLFEIEAAINPDPIEDENDLKDAEKFDVRTYTDKSKSDELPPFFQYPDYYFSMKQFSQSINPKLLEDLSDSEV